MNKIAVTVTSQVSLITSISYLEKKYSSITDVKLIVIIAHEQITDRQLALIHDMAKNIFSIERVVDIREALLVYRRYRKIIKESLFRYSKLNKIKKDLEEELQQHFNEIPNVDLLLIRKPSRFQELFVIKYINHSFLSRIEDGSNAILDPYIPKYYKYKSYIRKAAGLLMVVYYRLAGCGEETTFLHKLYRLPKVHSIYDGSIDSHRLLENFKKIKQPRNLDKFKSIKLMFLGTYDMSGIENSFNAIKKDKAAISVLKKKLSLNDNQILYKPHPKTFINMSYEDYSMEMGVNITTKGESLMMAECISVYIDDLNWIVSGAGSYSLFIISKMLGKVEPIMIKYKNNSHTKKQYDAAINKYIDMNDVEFIIV